jgi:hypothetical protein
MNAILEKGLKKIFLHIHNMSLIHEHYIIGIEIVGIGKSTAKIERIYSPITTERLTKALPINALGRFFIGGRDFFMIPIGIKKGAEKPVYEVEKGDLVYEASSDSLMICLNSCKTKTKVGRLGKIVSGLDLFEKIQRSNTIKLTLIE